MLNALSLIDDMTTGFGGFDDDPFDDRRSGSSSLLSIIDDHALTVAEQPDLDPRVSKLQAHVDALRKRYKPSAGDAARFLALPFGINPITAQENLDIANAAERIRDGTASERDYQTYARDIVRSEMAGNRTAFQKGVDLLVGAVKSGLEFGPGAAAAGGLARAGASIGFRESVKQAGKFSLGALASAGPGIAADEATARMIPGLGAEYDEQKNLLELVESDAGDDLLEAAGKGIGAALIEVGSESAGGPIVAAMSRVPGLKAAKQRILKHWLRMKPGRSVSMAGRLLATGGFNGILAEIGEERLVELLRGGTGLDPDFGATGDILSGDPERMREGATQVGIEAGAFGVLRGGGVLAENIGRPRRRSDSDFESAPWDDLRERLRKDPQSFAERWAAENPDRADRLARTETPSREDWAEFGPGMRLPAGERKAFADHVRRIRSPRPESPTTQEAPPQQEDLLAKIRREAGERDLNDATRELSGVNVESRGIPDPVAEQFDAHGTPTLETLRDLLEGGIDPQREFHTERLKMGMARHGAGGLRDHSPFVVISRPGQTLKQGGIGAVLVDPLHTPSIPDLQRRFPGVEFIPAESAAQRLQQLAEVSRAAPPTSTERARPEQSQTTPEAFPTRPTTPRAEEAAVPPPPQPFGYYPSNDGTNRSWGKKYGPAVRAVLNTDFVNYAGGMKRLQRGLPHTKQEQEELRLQLMDDYQAFTSHTFGGQPRSLSEDLTAADAVPDPALRRKLERLGFQVGKGGWKLEDARPATPLPEPEATKTPPAADVRFVPHPASNPEHYGALVYVDPQKLSAAWRDQGEIEGRREEFREFLKTGQPVAAPQALLKPDGTVAFNDGRHRFAELRDRGVERIAVNVPAEQAAEFERRFGPAAPQARPKPEQPAAPQPAAEQPAEGFPSWWSRDDVARAESSWKMAPLDRRPRGVDGYYPTNDGTARSFGGPYGRAVGGVLSTDLSTSWSPAMKRLVARQRADILTPAEKEQHRAELAEDYRRFTTFTLGHPRDLAHDLTATDAFAGNDRVRRRLELIGFKVGKGGWKLNEATPPADMPFQAPETPPDPAPGREPQPFKRGPQTAGGAAETVVEPTAAPLQQFAERVQQIAQSAPPSERFGGNKVFISHIASQLGMPKAEVARLLLDANRENLLALSRADLVEAMDPQKVRESEVRHPIGASFHFVTLPEQTPPREPESATAPQQPPSERILDAMRQDEPASAHPGGAAAYIPAMRRLSGLDPETFDATLRAMVKSGQLALQKHGHPSAVKESERQQFYRDDQGNLYHMVSVREGFTKPSSPQPAAPQMRDFRDTTPGDAIEDPLNKRQLEVVARQVATKKEAQALAESYVGGEVWSDAPKRGRKTWAVVRPMGAGAAKPRPTPQAAERTAPADLKDRVFREAVRIGGKEDVRVRIAEVRQAMPDVPRDVLDRTLLDMEREGRLSLYQLDNPREITPADREAAVQTAAGSKRHILYVGGQASSRPTAPTQEEPAFQAGPPKPRVSGRETTIRAEGFAQPIPATFAVMELADITPSHDYSGGVSVSNVKKGRYPSSLQPRDYSPASVEDEKVVRRAAQFDPRYLLSDAADALDGSPVVEPSGIVINGNSRAMMLQLLTSRNDPAFDRYREALIKRAGQFGIDRQSVESMRRPVLVRVVNMDPQSAEARRFAQAGNISTTGEQSTAETAKKFRAVIDTDLIGKIRLEADTTFSEAINSGSSAAREFRSALRKSLPQSQVARYFEGDQLSAAGRDLVRSVLLQEVVPEDLLDQLKPGELRMLDSAIPQLLKAKRDSAPGEDVTPALIEALRFLADHNPQDLADIDRVLRQGQMFRNKPTISPQARTVLEFLIANSRKSTALREALKRLLADLDQGPALFQVERPPFEDRLADAFSLRRGGGMSGSGAAYAPMAGESGATEFETEAAGEGRGGGGESVQTAVERLFPEGIRPLALPELVELARELMGKVPIVTRRVRRNLGLFKGMEGARVVEVLLRPDIFKDPVLAAKVLAHELGHLIDYLPDLTLKRGNILGRIASLRNHLAKFMAGRPGGPGPLSEAEYERLARIAEELATTTKEIEVDEEIRRVVPITPQQIIDVWNTVDTSKVNQDLLAYIKTLDRREKASIIKEAMKGLVPEDLQRFAQVFLEKTGRKVKRTVEHSGTKKAIREKFNELVLEEARKRQLLENYPIRQELIELTKWWSGDFSKAPPRYQRYRRSSRELYAEALSVFLNAPAELEKRAPTFFRGFAEYLERKPEVLAELLALQDLLAGTPEELAEHREARLFGGFGRGTEKIKAAAAARDQARLSVRDAVVQIVSQGILDRSAPVKGLQKAAEKKGATFRADQAPAYILDELFSIDNPNYLLLDRTQRQMYRPLLDAGITADDIGEYLFLRRVVNERNEIANPIGFDPQAAAEQIAYMQQKLGQERWRLLDQTMQRWHSEILWPIIEEAVESGVYSRKIFEESIKPNKGNYATFAVVKYLEDYIPAGLKHQIGTFEDIANPLHATLMKMITLQRAIQMNQAKAAIRDVLTDWFAGEIENVELRHGSKEPVRPARQGKDFMLMLEDGKLVAYEVEQSIARSYQSHDIGMLQQYGSILASKVYRFFHPLYVTFSPGFIVANPFRDIRRTHKLLGAIGTKLNRQLREELEAQGYTREQAREKARPQNITFAQVLKAWWKALPAAKKYARGEHAPEVERMLEDKALAIPYTQVAAETGELIPTNIPTMEDKNLAEKLKENRFAALRLLGRVMHGIEMIGTIQETATKLAGYNLLGERGVTGKERAFLVRKYVGTPDFKQKGLLTNITNSLLLYSKVRWNGLQAEARIATDPQTAVGYWWRTFVWAIAPTTLRKLAAYGLLAYFTGGDDEEEREWWAMVPKYDQDHYDIIPMGTTEQNGERKAVYLRIPRDEVSTAVARIYGSLVDATLEQFGTPTKTGGVKRAIQDAVGVAWGEVAPSWNPAIEMLSKWSAYGIWGINPTDDFTNEAIVPRTHWEAGGWAANKKMLAWTLDKFGVLSTIVHPVAGPVLGEAYTSGDETTLETTIRSTPGLNRLVRVSDRGKDEKLWLEIENKKAESAQFRLGLPKAARDLTLEQYMLTQATSLTREQQMRKVLLSTWRNVDYLPLTRAMQEAQDSGEDETFESLKRRLETSARRIDRGVENVPEEYLQRILWRLGDPVVNPAEDGSPAVTGLTFPEWLGNRRRSPETELLRRNGMSEERVRDLLQKEKLRQKQRDEDREANRAGREPRQFAAVPGSSAYWARMRRLRELFE